MRRGPRQPPRIGRDRAQRVVPADRVRRRAAWARRVRPRPTWSRPLCGARETIDRPSGAPASARPVPPTSTSRTDPRGSAIAAPVGSGRRSIRPTARWRPRHIRGPRRALPRCRPRAMKLLRGVEELAGAVVELVGRVPGQVRYPIIGSGFCSGAPASPRSRRCSAPMMRSARERTSPACTPRVRAMSSTLTLARASPRTGDPPRRGARTRPPRPRDRAVACVLAGGDRAGHAEQFVDGCALGDDGVRLGDCSGDREDRVGVGGVVHVHRRSPAGPVASRREEPRGQGGVSLQGVVAQRRRRPGDDPVDARRHCLQQRP